MGEKSFCTVSIETRGGSRHEFPDMPVKEVETMLKSIGSLSSSTLTLVNVHGACLTMPMRIVGVIAIDGEVTWRYPASSPPSLA